MEKKKCKCGSDMLHMFKDATMIEGWKCNCGLECEERWKWRDEIHDSENRVVNEICRKNLKMKYLD